MAIIKSSNSIEKNSFDYLRAYAETQSNNSEVVNELIQAYTLIIQNLGINAVTFVQQIKSGTISSLTMAGYLNSVRAKNALIGVVPNKNIPLFISREIAA